jgi:hypothetical protein
LALLGDSSREDILEIINKLIERRKDVLLIEEALKAVNLQQDPSRDLLELE